MSQTRVELPPVQFSAMSLLQVSAVLAECLGSLERRTFTFVNPYILCEAKRDLRLAQDLNAFDVVLADGIGIVGAARLLKLPIPQRISTDILCPELFRLCCELDRSVFLLGRTSGVTERAAKSLRQVFPALRIAGTLDGLDTDDKDRINSINRAKPDVLLVGLGTPLQQRWVQENAARVRAPLILTCGGYFDLLSRSPYCYPRWVYLLRLNWLYRLCREPRRLWRRYTFGMLEFLWLVFRARGGPAL